MALLFLLVVSAGISCAVRPAASRPQLAVARLADHQPSDAIRYRPLTRGDFRAAAPPAAASRHASIHAYTCTTIVPDGPTRASVVPGQTPGTYVARATGTSFHAEMDRTCSWWSDRPLPVPSEYVLQHEQIHFALVELEARRLTSDMQELEVVVESPPSAGPRLQERYDALLQAAAANVAREAERFDRETSFGYAPERQAEWGSRVAKTLGEKTL